MRVDDVMQMPRIGIDESKEWLRAYSRKPFSLHINH